METGFLLSHLESLSGVTSDRILRGFHEKDSRYNAGWARRGVAGMKLRPPEELIGNTLFATEFRTLVLPVGRKARNIFFAQIGELAQILVKPAIERLSEEAQLWSNIYKKIELRHTEASLPLDRTEWGNPDSEPGLWRRWGEVN